MKTPCGFQGATLVGLLALACLAGCADGGNQAGQRDFPVLSGDYLGQAPPGDQPALFAPGIVATGLHARDLTMTPDGDEIYFRVSVDGQAYTAVVVSRRVDGRWTRPEVAPFSTDPRSRVIEPFISPAGRQLYFASDRPDGDEEAGDFDIWVMDREGDDWGEPYSLGPPVNSEAPEFFPSLTRDGTIYFTRADPETRIDYIYRARPAGDSYQEPERLGETVNSGVSQFNAFIAPDESYLIVPVYGRKDSYGSTDYYICFRDADDNWTGPVNLGEKVNTAGGAEYSPYVSPDGKYFFFMSSRLAADEDEEPLSYRRILELSNSPGNGRSDIYWVDASCLATLRPQ